MKPHIYRLDGYWLVAPFGRERTDSNHDTARATFPEACQLAQLAAIYSGAWRP